MNGCATVNVYAIVGVTCDGFLVIIATTPEFQTTPEFRPTITPELQPTSEFRPTPDFRPTWRMIGGRRIITPS